MAKITYYKATPDRALPAYYQDTVDVDLRRETSSRVQIITDDEKKIVLHGEDLTYKHGEITGGTVSEVEFYTGHGKLGVFVEDLNFDAENFYKQISKKDLGIAIERFVFGGADDITGTADDDFLFGYNGNDEISGGKGEDEIGGGVGDDMLSGGKGRDVFQAGAKGSGDDIVSDFDIHGADHDVLKLFDGFKAVERGDDILLKFDNGATTVLEGLTMKDLQIVEVDWA